MNTEQPDAAGLRFRGASASATVSYDAAAQWLYLQWRGDYHTQNAQESWDLLLRCLRTYPCTKVLNDTRDITSGWAGDEQWVAEAQFPRLAQQGVQYMACVYSPSWAARFSLDFTVSFATQPFIAAFDDLATACA